MAIRTAFGRNVLQAPEPFTGGGWRLFARYPGGPLVTLTVHTDSSGCARTLASISRNDRSPDPADVDLLRRAVFGDADVEVTMTCPDDLDGINANAVYLIGPEHVLPRSA